MLASRIGFTVDLTQEDMQKCLMDSGCCIAGQTATLVPADRIMYATRDITSTVDNVNFVTGSLIKHFNVDARWLLPVNFHN